MNDIVANIIIKVLLANGKEINHTYDTPKSEKDLKKFLRDVVDRTLILRRGQSGYLWFDNPNVVYNPDQVSGIEITSLGVKEREAIIRKAQAKVGYVKGE